MLRLVYTCVVSLKEFNLELLVVLPWSQMHFSSAQVLSLASKSGQHSTLAPVKAVTGLWIPLPASEEA